jgi:hypothetical protein
VSEKFTSRVCDANFLYLNHKSFNGDSEATSKTKKPKTKKKVSLNGIPRVPPVFGRVTKRRCGNTVCFIFQGILSEFVVWFSKKKHQV